MALLQSSTARSNMKRIILIAVAALALAAPAVAQASGPSVAGGKFEVTCKPHAIPDQAIDPIVSPGVTSAHLHTFFGNRGLTSTSTPASLQASTAGTTCVLPQDTAAYWLPVACNGVCVPVLGGDPERGPFVNAITPVKVFAYYFGTPQVVEAQFSPALQLIGGDSHATAPSGSKQMIEFACGNGGSHSSPVRPAPYDCTAANGVKGTDGVVAIVTFPYCGAASADGVPTAYGDPTTGLCGGLTPVTYGQVQIHEHLGLDTTGYQTGSTLNFSSGPYYTLHGDWMNGWVQTKLQSLVAGCLDVDKDCGFLTNTSPGP